MRLLLSTLGSRGDVEPLVALAVQLRALGAEVRVAAPPDEEFAQRLAGVGVPLVPVGPPMRAMMAGTGGPSPEDLPALAAGVLAAQFGVVGAAAEDCDVLVAAGLMQVAARSVAEKLGIRYVYASYCPIMLPSPHHPPLTLPDRPSTSDVTENRELWDPDGKGFNELFGQALNAQRLAIGLPPVGNVRDHVITDTPWMAADPVLAPWLEPTDLGVTQTGAWLVPDDRPLPAELRAFLDAGTPPVFVSFGSGRAPEGAARVAIEAIRAHGHRALIARGWADLDLIDDGGDCFVVGEANHQALLTRVSAVVHHGGAGTTTAAARAGVPQVVIPQSVDQPYWAARVADLGIGAAHADPNPTTESLKAALATALAPETRDRATAVAGTIRTDGAAVAAKLLLDTATQNGRPASA
ncbi:glycosyltransferase [Streptomyces ficellus]|uniref:Glycosyltransferase n=1 Tax=Streptomyces ficellus TaxID=1977088 RepID=A0A6I6F8I3_9ACTN|nr:glycosyltransferase [Streptomyces ficellus]QGV79331.1 glycosyltransferase [Streptomyces ficellus]